MTKVGSAGLALAAVLGVGCASHPAPTDQIASSVAAVRVAEEAGAASVPKAALHMKLAEEQIAQAKSLMDDGDNLEAEDRAMRAYQDAEMALALAREQQAKKKLDHMAQVQSSGGEQIPQGIPSESPTMTSPTTSPTPIRTQ